MLMCNQRTLDLNYLVGWINKLRTLVNDHLLFALFSDAGSVGAEYGFEQAAWGIVVVDAQRHHLDSDGSVLATFSDDLQGWP